MCQVSGTGDNRSLVILVLRKLHSLSRRDNETLKVLEILLFDINIDFPPAKPGRASLIPQKWMTKQVIGTARGQLIEK